MQESYFEGVLSTPETTEIRRFSGSTPSQLMCRVYEKLVPGNNIDIELFREITDPDLIERRDNMYWTLVERAENLSLANGGNRLYVDEDSPYRNTYDSSSLNFYNASGEVITLTTGESVSTYFGVKMPDIAKPDVHVPKLLSAKQVRILDAGIGLSSLIYKVRREVEDLGIVVETNGINIVSLPDGAHPDLDNLFIGKFEECDFDGKQFELIYSNIACARYAPNEVKFITKLESILASGGIAIMDIEGPERWRAALEDCASLDYEFLYSIENAEIIKHYKQKTLEVGDRILDCENNFEAAVKQFKEESPLSEELMEQVISELRSANSMHDDLPRTTEAFNTISKESKSVLNHLYLKFRNLMQNRSHLKNCQVNIETSCHSLVSGLLIAKK